METKRIPRKLKKAFKSLWLKDRPMWKSSEIRIDRIDKHYIHWRKVEHVNRTALMSMRLVPH